MKVYVAKTGLQTFEGFTENAKVKMWRLGDHCSIIGKDHTSLLNTKMTRDFRNKIMAVECVFSKGQCWEWSRRDL
jgi:hypothetical protein